jgi:hypothetical protein
VPAGEGLSRVNASKINEGITLFARRDSRYNAFDGSVLPDVSANTGEESEAVEINAATRRRRTVFIRSGIGITRNHETLTNPAEKMKLFGWAESSVRSV